MDSVAPLWNVSKFFNSVPNLQNHVDPGTQVAKKSSHVCEICSRDFNSRQALWNHRKTIHANFQFAKRKTEIKCGECNAVFESMVKLCEHLKDAHNFDVKIETFTFKTKLDFENWRREIERRGRFEFVASQGSVVRNNCLKQYLHCHRSGYFKSKSKGLRQPKTVQTNRINYHCCAFATVSMALLNEEVTVKACLQHYGHDDLLIRVKLPKQVQNAIGEMLKQDKDPDYIVDHFKRHVMRNDEGMMSVERHNFITRKDIENIQRRLHLTLQRQLATQSGQSNENYDEWEPEEEEEADEGNNNNEQIFCFQPQQQEQEGPSLTSPLRPNDDEDEDDEQESFQDTYVVVDGQNVYRLSAMHYHHRKAVQLNKEHVRIVEDGFIWQIASDKSPQLVYTVSKMALSCVCKLRCVFCHVCPHLYSCTCPNALVQNAACEHIHLVHETFSAATATAQVDDTNLVERDSFEDDDDPACNSNDQQGVEDSKYSAGKQMQLAKQIMEILPVVLPIECIEDESIASQILQKMQEVRQMCCYALNVSESELMVQSAKGSGKTVVNSSTKRQTPKRLAEGETRKKSKKRQKFD